MVKSLRARGVSDDAIVQELINAGLAEVSLPGAIAKALGTPKRYGFPVGPALEALSKAKPGPPVLGAGGHHRADRIKKLREAGHDLGAGDGADLTHVNRQVQVAKSRGAGREPITEGRDLTDRFRKASADRKAELED